MKAFIIGVITTLILIYISYQAAIHKSPVKKAKADAAKINVIMNPKTGTVNTDLQTINIIIQPENPNNTISGLYIPLKATGTLKIVEVAKPESFPAGDSTIFSEVRNDISADRARLSYVATLPDEKLPKAVKIKVKIAGYSAGAGTLSIDSSALQIVGKIPGYTYENNSIDSAELIFSETGTSGIQPTGRISTSEKSLTLKIRMQGVADRPLYQNTIVNVKITLVHPTTGITYEYEVPVISIGQGIWRGNIPIDAPTGSGYTVLVKGGLHLQKKAPTSYSIVDGENTIDLSKVTLSVGDIRGENNKQDGIIDAQDISYIRSHLGDAEQSEIKSADLNFDGVVDSQDYALMISSIKYKVDER